MTDTISIYWDADTDPANPGYVLRYYDRGQENTWALNARCRASAREEAAQYLGMATAAMPQVEPQ